jgi:bacteriocin biosynthesis cyclodehydratase domain-containing protein
VRPVLAPAVRHLWRDPSTLQLGTSPTRSVMVEGLDEGRRRLLPLLDGRRTREEVVMEARAAGCDDPDATLRTLEEAGVLLDADALLVPALDRADRDRLGPDLGALTLARGPRAADHLLARRGRRVVVHGAGRVGGPLAALLAEAGVGTVDVRDDEPARPADSAVGGVRPQDAGSRRGEAVARRLRSAGSSHRPDLVVLADDPTTAGSTTGDTTTDTARVLERDGIPHLVVRVDGTVGLVGPLVLPGRTGCLRCLDLVRTAIDPAWPLLAAQRPVTRNPEACDGVLAVAVAAQAALQVLELLDGDVPASAGGTLELEIPGWRWSRRTWPPHPACGCAAAVPEGCAAAG